MSTRAGEVTELLRELDGTAAAPAVLERLMPLVQDELRSLADAYLARERPDHTLQPTALVNEAYLKLVDQRNASWESRGHFMAIAATAMRRVLVHHARARGRRKRGGDAGRVTLGSSLTAVQVPDLDLLALDDALRQLAALDPRKVQVVELRFFVGLSVEETAMALHTSPATVKRDWQMAKAWLLRAMAGDSTDGAS